MNKEEEIKIDQSLINEKKEILLASGVPSQAVDLPISGALYYQRMGGIPVAAIGV